MKQNTDTNCAIEQDTHTQHRERKVTLERISWSEDEPFHLF